MKTPKSIMYKGAKYVLAATKHERCPRGKHWNENTKRCEKMPMGLGSVSQFAHIQSDNAKKKQAPAEGLEPRAAIKAHDGNVNRHLRAFYAHMNAHMHAVSSGHYDLAHKHELMADHHAHKVDHHTDTANKIANKHDREGMLTPGEYAESYPPGHPGGHATSAASRISGMDADTYAKHEKKYRNYKRANGLPSAKKTKWTSTHAWKL